MALVKIADYRHGVRTPVAHRKREGGFWRPVLLGEGRVDSVSMANWMNVTWMVKEVIQLFRYMRSDHKCVIHVTKPASEIVRRPAEGHLVTLFHEEEDSDT